MVATVIRAARTAATSTIDMRAGTADTIDGVLADDNSAVAPRQAPAGVQSGQRRAPSAAELTAPLRWLPGASVYPEPDIMPGPVRMRSAGCRRSTSRSGAVNIHGLPTVRSGRAR